MSIEDQAADFLAQERIAVVGVSRKKGTGQAIFSALRKRGHKVIPVNPNLSEIDDEPCYSRLQDIPDGVGAAVLVTRPETTETVVRDCAEAKVPRVWMHYNALFGSKLSSASDDAIAFCREHQIDVIPGGCPLMFGEGADFGHRCMRWLLGVTGKLR